jgi:hypothetical protein
MYVILYRKQQEYLIFVYVDTDTDTLKIINKFEIKLNMKII